MTPKTYRMPFVTFRVQGRTGNNLFQYLLCKVLQIKFGHTYRPIEDSCSEEIEDIETIYENDIENILKRDYFDKNILCIGYFQRSELYLPYREELLDSIRDSDDYWTKDDKKVFIRDFMNDRHHHILTKKDIVVSLRLDDFIQYPCPKSDIIPPEYYFELLENVMSNHDRLFIVSDKMHRDWEIKYLEFFQKWNPIMVQGDIFSDFALMRDCPTLVHSNSTFCWLASFLCNSIPTENLVRDLRSQQLTAGPARSLGNVTFKKKRYIPNTHFYAAQSLGKIENDDTITDVVTLSHDAVHNIDIKNYLRDQAHPMSYCIPDEYIIDDCDISDKKVQQNSLIPEEKRNYRFGPDQESEYLQSYRECMFSNTQKKGGWDCLRHYEIMASGCIPIFPHLEDCPPTTMTTFPKQLVMESSQQVERSSTCYQIVIQQLLHHMRKNCSASANTKQFLETVKVPIKNILLIVGHPGTSYTRELFWIGMKRHIQSMGGVAVEYPRLDTVYKDFPVDKKKGLHGNGFIYTNKLDDDYSFSEDEIIEKIKSKFFDMVVYGKVGPDEMETGTLPHFPLWEHVFKRYTRDEIVCLYGGDECIDLTCKNAYSDHFYHTAQYTTCFVRELRKPTE